MCVCVCVIVCRVRSDHEVGPGAPAGAGEARQQVAGGESLEEGAVVRAVRHQTYVNPINNPVRPQGLETERAPSHLIITIFSIPA